MLQPAREQQSPATFVPSSLCSFLFKPNVSAQTQPEPCEGTKERSFFAVVLEPDVKFPEAIAALFFPVKPNVERKTKMRLRPGQAKQGEGTETPYSNTAISC
jgi:hypothetical protein